MQGAGDRAGEDHLAIAGGPHGRVVGQGVLEAAIAPSVWGRRRPEGVDHRSIDRWRVHDRIDSTRRVRTEHNDERAQHRERRRNMPGHGSTPESTNGRGKTEGKANVKRRARRAGRYAGSRSCAKIFDRSCSTALVWI